MASSAKPEAVGRRSAVGEGAAVELRRHQAVLRPGQTAVLLLVCATVASAACTSSAPAGGNRSPYSADTVVQQSVLGEHLSFLNGAAVGFRATGTREFADAATYAALRMGSYGLQPVMQKDFTRFYATSLNFPRGADVRLLSPDTLRLRSGVDVGTDPRSNADSLRFDRIFWDPAPGDDVRGLVVAVPESPVSNETLLGLVDRGARAVLIRGGPVVGPTQAPLTGLTAVRITPEALRLLLPFPGTVSGSERRLPVAAEIRTHTEYAPAASAINVVGILTGSDPVLRNELIVVSARLDGPAEMFVEAPIARFNSGLAAATLLESARILAELQRWSHPLDRSVLFALWSGSMQENAGLAAFLKHPPWAREAIFTFVRIRDPGEDDGSARRITEDAGYAYVSVPSASLARTTDPAGRGESTSRSAVVAETAELVRNVVATVLRLTIE